MRTGTRAGAECRQQSQGFRQLVEYSNLRFRRVLERQQDGEIAVTQEKQQGIGRVSGREEERQRQIGVQGDG